METIELGIVSDLDKTVVPPADPDLSKAPYPGVTRLYQILELGDGAYALVQPLVSGAMRCTLRGGAGGELIAEVQSGDPAVASDGMELACFVAAGDDPYELLRRSFGAAADGLDEGVRGAERRLVAQADRSWPHQVALLGEVYRGNQCERHVAVGEVPAPEPAQAAFAQLERDV